MRGQLRRFSLYRDVDSLREQQRRDKLSPDRSVAGFSRYMPWPAADVLEQLVYSGYLQ